LLNIFFDIHDPTQLDKQGGNIGKQYSSNVFYKNNKEKKVILGLINILKAKGYKIATKVQPFQEFWIAEEYHQNYYVKNKIRPLNNVNKTKF
jgi:peptide methionine sulfoxide reductase msrA/msrB